MSLVQVRQEIDEKLDTLDETMLKAIHLLLHGPTPVKLEAPDESHNYESDGTLIKADVLIAQINEIDHQVETGETKLIPMKDAFENVEKWLKVTE
jgi:hypothetical protein